MTQSREERNAKARESYRANREFNVARAMRYYHENRERCNARTVDWRATRRPMDVVIYNNVKGRAKQRGIPFSLAPEHIIVPEFCPILGLRLEIGRHAAQPNSPSVDRIDSAKGYEPGNVHVISHKANTIKSNATLAELEAVVAYLRRIM